MHPHTHTPTHPPLIQTPIQTTFINFLCENHENFDNVPINISANFQSLRLYFGYDLQYVYRYSEKKNWLRVFKTFEIEDPPSKYVILNISASRALRNLPLRHAGALGGDYSQTDFRTFSSVTSAVIGENVTYVFADFSGTPPTTDVFKFK